MAYQLWKSTRTGYRRKGTPMGDLRKLLETSITADAIQEPLKYCIYGESALSVKAELVRLDFDIAGIRTSKDQPTLEFVRTASLRNGNCEEVAKPIKAVDIISEATPLIDVLRGLKDRTYFFIQNGMHISGIITRADLQKPPIRILIFGVISLLEMHLNYLIRRHYPNETWRAVLKQKRISNAETILMRRKGRNEVIDLTDCLQFADIRDLVVASPKIRAHLGFRSEREASELLETIEEIRNKKAYSQDIVSGTTWEKWINILSKVEAVILRSDDLVEKEE